MNRGLTELYKEIRDGGVVLFVVVGFMLFMGFATYRAEQRADKYAEVMANERIITNQILSELSSTMKSVQHRLDTLEFRMGSRKVILEPQT